MQMIEQKHYTNVFVNDTEKFTNETHIGLAEIKVKLFDKGLYRPFFLFLAVIRFRYQ